MSSVRAVARYLRVSPRKARLVVRRLKGMPALKALEVLKLMPQKAARLACKVVKSAIANAEHNYGMDPEKLVIVKAVVDEGPRLKRIKPRAFGRADLMIRRYSHITIEVDQKEEG